MLTELERTHPVMVLRKYIIIPPLRANPNAYVNLEGRIDQLFDLSVDHRYTVRSRKGEVLSRMIFADVFAPIVPTQGIDIPAVLLDVMGVTPNDNPILLTPTVQEDAVRFARKYIYGVNPDVIAKVLKYSPRGYEELHTSLTKFVSRPKEVWVNSKAASALENQPPQQPFQTLGDLYDAILEQRINRAA